MEGTSAPPRLLPLRFGMVLHFSVCSYTGLVNGVVAMPAIVHDLTLAHRLPKSGWENQRK